MLSPLCMIMRHALIVDDGNVLILFLHLILCSGVSLCLNGELMEQKTDRKDVQPHVCVTAVMFLIDLTRVCGRFVANKAQTSTYNQVSRHQQLAMEPTMESTKEQSSQQTTEKPTPTESNAAGAGAGTPSEL